MKKILRSLQAACLVVGLGLPLQAAAQQVFINEIHYDNVGTDAGEGIEIAGPAGADLSGWKLVPYNGANGQSYSIQNLSGTIPAQQAGFGTVFVPIANLQNGDPDGIALVDAAGAVVQFLSYEGTFAATNGPATGLTSTDIGVKQGTASPVGFSLQLTGTGKSYTDFTWAPEAASTYNAVNNGQSFIPLQAVVFINELHYDNAGTDAGEGVEVAGNAGTDLAGWSIVAYNGNDGKPYKTTSLAGVLPNQQNGYGTLFFEIKDLQNGSPDAVALVNANGEVVEFLSYEGAFTAVGGPADGMASTAIVPEETGTTPIGFSLQLTGSGFKASDFTWSVPIASTYNKINAGQSFGDGPVEPEPNPEPQKVTIAQARKLPLGTEVIVNGTLTAAGELGGPAFIQDNTGGIALFEFDVHNGEDFAIGDSLQVIAVIGAFNQQVQLVDVIGFTDLGVAKNPIASKQVSIAEISTLEGQLVTIPNATFTDTRGLLFPESNYTITDNTGTTQLRIDGDVESLVGRVKPQEAVTVTGVLGSFRGALQLFPRFRADLPGTAPYLPKGTDVAITKTLDVMTWNMEFFGATQKDFGPADNELQLQNAFKLIDSVKADVIAVQEISDEALLQRLVDMLPGYKRICSDRYSYSFDGEDPAFPAQKVCFLYNTAVISVVDEQVIFEEMYDAARLGASTPLDKIPGGNPSSFWSSGRLPYMLTVDATVEGVTERYQLINIHAKSGSASADLTRRRFDVQALKDTLDQYYPNANIVMLGDYNDDVDVSIGGGTTTYNPFVSSDNFKTVTASLSEAGLRSFITQDNVIDHITISNELYDNYLVGTETLVIPFNLIPNYANTTSDHLAVVTRFELADPLTVDAGKNRTVYYGYAPQASTTLTASDATGGKPGYTYQWSNGQTGQSITVSPSETTVYTVTVTDAIGRTATDSVQVCVVDVSYKNGMVQICYNASGKPGLEKSLQVPAKLVESFLAKGATLGSCGVATSCEDAPAPVAPAAAANVYTFTAYPNPVKDNVTMSFGEVPASKKVTVVIFNSQGTEVYNRTHALQGNSLELNLTSLRLKEGLYYLKAGNETGTHTVRIVKE
ncbi:T9SS type A sorting domain-containing protein [Pontibacter arcticus]|uniref:LTD domain-containing protein n=1 Tax=Pontibacter arcticus TaxID=2080288 RepID=A0A364RC22_9BACT|nr:T9SS type A sorting domain-containing protein [Pontibacter arcticus]RAU81805.1 hypothetical protein DP923_13995 [Pontibacter arcticus]